MACIPAPACKEALAEASRLYPNRSRASDGICASATHSSQNSSSDHERGEAFDLTHDPANGCDAHALVEGLKFRVDPRIKYIISNSRIWNPSISPAWRPYSGSNPHNKHAHVSIHPSARNDLSPWFEEEDMPLSADDLAKIKQIVVDRTGDVYNLLNDRLGKVETFITERTGHVHNLTVAELEEIKALLSQVNPAGFSDTDRALLKRINDQFA